MTMIPSSSQSLTQSISIPFPPRDVKEVVEAWLEEVKVSGFAVLRIIHGRGIGVQREMVRSILSRDPDVLTFGDAPLEAGGWGATVVTLRR